jgi:hypothetical protein
MRQDILEGDAVDLLPTLASESIQAFITSPAYWGLLLDQIFSASILSAVHPFVALPTKRNHVVRVKSQRLISCPGLKVMCVQTLGALLWCRTSNAFESIASVHSSKHCFEFRISIESLPLGRTTINVVRVLASIFSIHAIGSAAQPWFWHRCFFTKQLLSSDAMLLALKRVYSSSLLHVIVLLTQILPAWTSGYSKVLEFLMNPLRVSSYQASNFIRRQAFINVLGTKPNRIQMLGFFHNK